MNKRTLAAVLISLAVITLFELALIQAFEILHLPVDLSFFLLFIINGAVFSILWALWHFGVRYLIKCSPLTRLNLKAKLVLSFGFMTLVPTVLMLIVSYNLLEKSIENWANEKVALAFKDTDDLTKALEAFRTLLMTDSVEKISWDNELARALSQGGDITERARTIAQSEDYLLAIYDAKGIRLFSESEYLPRHFSTYLPTIEKLPDEPMTFDTDVGGEGLYLCAKPIYSEDVTRRVGAVLIGQLTPFTRSEVQEIREKIDELKRRVGEGQASYQQAAATRKPALKEMLILLLLTSALILLIAFWATSMISRSITEPIKNLVRGTKQISKGNLKYRVSVHTKDEFALLAGAFNQMTEDLERSTDELKRAEKLAAWREIAQKLAHEIKNPLTPIQLNAQRLQLRYHRNPEGYGELVDQLTNIIIDEVEGIRRLLDEFSRLARLPAPELKPTDIHAIIEKAIELMGELPANVTINSDIAANLPLIPVDEEQMKRAIFNIIKNAVESMMGRGGKLTIKADLAVKTASVPSKRQVVIQFIDTGPGVPPEVQSKLFVPHFSTKKDGMGLGLAIVKKTIDAHGGEITVDTNPPEPGTTFTIRLPIAN